MMRETDDERVRISIHAPREGGDVIISMALRKKVYFNPRPPARGATW